MRVQDFSIEMIKKLTKKIDELNEKLLYWTNVKEQ